MNRPPASRFSASKEAGSAVSHHALLEVPEAERAKLRDTSNWRVHGFHHHATDAAAVFRSPALARMAS